MGDFDEGALVERCRSGDDTAFGELVEQYKDLVYAVVYRMTADRMQVDDLAQEVFLKVHRGLAVLSRRCPALDLDIPHRAERVQSGARAAAPGAFSGRP